MGRMPGWVPRAHRVPVYLSSIACLSDGRVISVIIADLSTRGCLVLCPEQLPIGDNIELQVNGQTIAWASVRWSLPGKAGLRFLQLSVDFGEALH